MIRRLTLSLLAAGCLIATAHAAPMPSQAAPEKPALAADAAPLTTGRSGWHDHHWHHHHWHHHHWHPHHWHHWHHHH